MRSLAILICLLALAGIRPAGAQTFEDAVRANVSLATGLCADAMLTGGSAAAIFGGAGFVQRSVDRGTNAHGVALGMDHYFDAPAETAKAEVQNLTGHPGLCQVQTQHLSQADVSALVTNTLLNKFPGTEVRTSSEWFIRGVSDLPLIVTLRTIADNHRYEPPGTVEVSMTFPG